MLRRRRLLWLASANQQQQQVLPKRGGQVFDFITWSPGKIKQRGSKLLLKKSNQQQVRPMLLIQTKLQVSCLLLLLFFIITQESLCLKQSSSSSSSRNWNSAKGKSELNFENQNLKSISIQELCFAHSSERLAQVNSVSFANNQIRRLESNAFVCVSQALKILILRHNEIELISSSAFAKLDLVQVLLLDNNRLGSIPSRETLKPLKSLRHLNLANNRIETIDEPSFGDESANLISLNLKGNPLHRVASNSFASLVKLKTLTLSQSALSGQAPTLLGLTELRFLHLDRATNLSDAREDLCSDSRKLASLLLKSNQLQRVPQFSHCQSLLQLDLSYNKIKGSLNGNFSSQTNLLDLYLSHNQLNTLEEQAFLGLVNLQVLELNNNQLLSIHPRAFIQVRSSLFEINVSNNRKLTKLPSEGLEKVASIKAFGNLQLKELPHFEAAHSLALTYAYHCCDYLENDKDGDTNMIGDEEVSNSTQLNLSSSSQSPMSQMVATISTKLRRFFTGNLNNNNESDAIPMGTTIPSGGEETLKGGGEEESGGNDDAAAAVNNLTELVLWPQTGGELFSEGNLSRHFEQVARSVGFPSGDFGHLQLERRRIERRNAPLANKDEGQDQENNNDNNNIATTILPLSGASQRLSQVEQKQKQQQHKDHQRFRLLLRRRPAATAAIEASSSTNRPLGLIDELLLWQAKQIRHTHSVGGSTSELWKEPRVMSFKPPFELTSVTERRNENEEQIAATRTKSNQVASEQQQKQQEEEEEMDWLLSERLINLALMSSPLDNKRLLLIPNPIENNNDSIHLPSTMMMMMMMVNHHHRYDDDDTTVNDMNLGEILSSDLQQTLTTSNFNRGRRHLNTEKHHHQNHLKEEPTNKRQCLPKPSAFLPCKDLFDTWLLRTGIWFVFLLAFSGNILVIVVLSSVRQSSSASALTSIMWLAHSKRHIDVPRFLVINLAIADLLMALYLGLLAAVDLTTLGQFKMFAIRWQYSTGCKLAGFLGVLSSELSVFILAIITLERNYAITNAVHLNRRLSLQKAMLIMLFGYAFALSMAIMPLHGISDYRKFSICLPLDIDSSLSSQIYVFTLVGINTFSFILLLSCYLRMYCAIRGSQAWNTNDLRIAKRMSILVITDFLCWMPIILVASASLFGYHLIGLEGIKTLTIFVLPLNSIANPFLYAITTKKFKRDLDTLMRRLRIIAALECISRRLSKCYGRFGCNRNHNDQQLNNSSGLGLGGKFCFDQKFLNSNQLNHHAHAHNNNNNNNNNHYHYQQKQQQQLMLNGKHRGGSSSKGSKKQQQQQKQKLMTNANATHSFRSGLQQTQNKRQIGRNNNNNNNNNNDNDNLIRCETANQVTMNRTTCCCSCQRFQMMNHQDNSTANECNYHLEAAQDADQVSQVHSAAIIRLGSSDQVGMQMQPRITLNSTAAAPLKLKKSRSTLLATAAASSQVEKGGGQSCILIQESEEKCRAQRSGELEPGCGSSQLLVLRDDNNNNNNQMTGAQSRSSIVLAAPPSSSSSSLRRHIGRRLGSSSCQTVLVAPTNEAAAAATNRRFLSVITPAETNNLPDTRSASACGAYRASSSCHHSDPPTSSTATINRQQQVTTPAPTATAAAGNKDNCCCRRLHSHSCRTRNCLIKTAVTSASSCDRMKSTSVNRGTSREKLSHSINRLLFGPIARAWSSMHISLGSSATNVVVVTGTQNNGGGQSPSQSRNHVANQVINIDGDCCKQQHYSAREDQIETNSPIRSYRPTEDQCRNNQNSNDSDDNLLLAAQNNNNTNSSTIDDILLMSSPSSRRILLRSGERRMSRSCDMIPTQQLLSPTCSIGGAAEATTTTTTTSHGDYDDDQRILLATINRMAGVAGRRRTDFNNVGRYTQRGQQQQQQQQKVCGDTNDSYRSQYLRDKCVRCRSWSPALLSKLEDCIYQIRSKIPRLSTVQGESSQAHETMQQSDSSSVNEDDDDDDDIGEHDDISSSEDKIIGQDHERDVLPQLVATKSGGDNIHSSSSASTRAESQLPMERRRSYLVGDCVMSEDEDEDLEDLDQDDKFNEGDLLEWDERKRAMSKRSHFQQHRKHSMKKLQKQSSANSDTLSTRTGATILTNMSVSFDSTTSIPILSTQQQQQQQQPQPQLQERSEKMDKDEV